MFVIACYDIQGARVVKVMKLFRRYLSHVQRSVFEGELTEAQLRDLEAALAALINPKTDSVILYRLQDERWIDRETKGNSRPYGNIL